ncbi:MAG: hypothetical protein ACTSV2_02570 [Candidatus Thorarchaeota archaeon]
MTERRSLEESFPNLPKALLQEDGIKSFFFILRGVLSNPSSELFELAKEALRTMELSVNADEQFDVTSFMPTIVSFLSESMATGDSEDRKNFTWAVAILAKKGYDVCEVLPRTIEWLDSKDALQNQYAAWILRNCAWSGFDLSSFVDAMKLHLDHSEYEVRNYLAQAVSNELIRTGSETEMQIVSNLFDNEELDSNYWRVDVHHRSYHAIDNTILPRPKYAAHFQLLRMCGNCGHPDAYCIYFYDDSGTGWTDRISEFYCEECGKYTVYHYVD